MRILVYNYFPIPLEDVALSIPATNFAAICSITPYDLKDKGILTYGLDKQLLDNINWETLPIRELRTLEKIEGYEQEEEPQYVKSKNRSTDFMSIISPYSFDAEMNCTFHSPLIPNHMNSFFSMFLFKEKRMKFPKFVKTRLAEPHLIKFLKHNKVNVKIIEDSIEEKIKNCKLNMGVEDLLSGVDLKNPNIDKEALEKSLGEVLDKSIKEDNRG